MTTKIIKQTNKIESDRLKQEPSAITQEEDTVFVSQSERMFLRQAVELIAFDWEPSPENIYEAERLPGAFYGRAENCELFDTVWRRLFIAFAKNELPFYTNHYWERSGDLEDCDRDHQNALDFQQQEKRVPTGDTAIGDFKPKASTLHLQCISPEGDSMYVFEAEGIWLKRKDIAGFVQHKDAPRQEGSGRTVVHVNGEDPIVLEYCSELLRAVLNKVSELGKLGLSDKKEFVTSRFLGLRVEGEQDDGRKGTFTVSQSLAEKISTIVRPLKKTLDPRRGNRR